MGRHFADRKEELRALETDLAQRSHVFLAHGLGSASSVQSSLKLLARKDIVQKENGEHCFSDPWFRQWIAREGR